MYLYETHLHTSPVSRCARASVRESLIYYKEIGYTGVFITNHFIDGNIGIDHKLPYEERIRFFFSDYEEGLRVGKEIGLSVFCGVESSIGGTDFLVYGLPMEWYLAHPEIDGMQKSAFLTLVAEEGALIVQAHPFREAAYIDHIRLFPRHVHAVEVFNVERSEHENRMAEIYAKEYGLLRFAGSDNHVGDKKRVFGGMRFDTPIMSETDFVARVKAGEGTLFRRENGIDVTLL